VLYVVEIIKSGKKFIYACDTVSLNHITAKEMDYYFLEANHSEADYDIVAEQSNAIQAVSTHLSKENSYNFFMRNKGENSVYVPLHQRIEFK